MKAFLNSMALMLFVFALVVAFFTFALVEVDLHNSAQPSLVVEQARWYRDAAAHYCHQNIEDDPDYFSTEMKPGIDFSASSTTTTVAKYYGNDIVAIEEQFERNYAPAVEIEKVKEQVPNLRVWWKSCDPDGDTLTFDVVGDSVIYCDGVPGTPCSSPQDIPLSTDIEVIADDGTLTASDYCTYGVDCPLPPP